MDLFSRLNLQTRRLIWASSLFLTALAFGILLFGDDARLIDQELLKQAQGSIKADMLYTHPVGH
jgi:hypothetical protein